MALSTAEYAGWVKELDRYEAMDSDDGDGDDPRVEGSSRTARSALHGKGTARRLSKPPPARGSTSVAEELEQEMKLLNWHKLANEAALKAAIIKTNKIKHEDARVASSLAREDADDKRLRVQQIIEEEQLKPLEVNSEFFRTFEAREQRDDDKVESDVQRHIQHLRRLKETMAQREDMHLRRRRYKEGLQELGGSLKSQSVPKGRHPPSSSNQEDDAAAAAAGPRRQRRVSSVAHKDSSGISSSATHEVLCSLDKLMELEKRIRHLEDAGLGVDGLEQHGDSGGAANGLALVGDDLESDSGNNNGVNALRSTKNLRFAKRKSSGGFHEPAKTVYAVKTAARPRPRNGSSSSLMQGTATSTARKRSLASTAGTSSANAKKPTFLTALPESKQRQLRRMTDRERRQFLKKEKASERQEQARHQDVVIQDWMQKKRQAAQQRKTANANAQAQTQAQPTRTTRAAMPGAAPAPPRVKAPLRGAAAGRHAANPHQQKFEDLRKGFDKRRESLRNAPTTAVAQRTNKVLELRSAVNDMRHKKPRQARADGAGASALRSHHPQQQHHQQQHPPATTKLPAIARAGAAPPPSQLSGKAHFSSGAPIKSTSAATATTTTSTASSVRLPRLAPVSTMSNARAFMAMPSPPPASAKNPAMPQFSRLHKR
ncbi:hypothetical protein PINS_up013058 [Pythium insidiosum]|nr:hypothetical protein PINS_up013058 [Pythium insidiosum]